MGILDRFFGPPKKDKFAALMMLALKRAGKTADLTYDAAEFRLLEMDGTRQRGLVNLENLYVEYCGANKGDRAAWLQRTVRGLLSSHDTPQEYEDVRPDLLPTVRARSMLEIMRLDAENSGDKPIELPSLPLTEHLVIAFVYDLPTTMQFVTQEKLDAWGVSLYEVFETARQNLAEREFSLMCLDDRLYISENSDAYDATRMLLTDRLRGLNLTGDPVVLPLARDCLLITGDEDDAGLGIMADLAEKTGDRPRPVCPILVVLRGDDWEQLRLPVAHEHFEKFRMIELKYYYGEYAEQKRLTDALNEQLGRDVFVASFSAVERSGRVLSYCTWTRGVRTWLPQTQYVALIDLETGVKAFVPWERLEETVGHRLEPLDCYPPRWLVETFPSPDEIAEMQPEDWSK